eukprot:COSAG01_NODE_28174_length_667_cov_1.304577_1_plen_26_part_10
MGGVLGDPNTLRVGSLTKGYNMYNAV